MDSAQYGNIHYMKCARHPFYRLTAVLRPVISISCEENKLHAALIERSSCVRNENRKYYTRKLRTNLFCSAESPRSMGGRVEGGNQKSQDKYTIWTNTFLRVTRLFIHFLEKVAQGAG